MGKINFSLIKIVCFVIDGPHNAFLSLISKKGLREKKEMYLLRCSFFKKFLRNIFYFYLLR